MADECDHAAVRVVCWRCGWRPDGHWGAGRTGCFFPLRDLLQVHGELKGEFPEDRRQSIRDHPFICQRASEHPMDKVSLRRRMYANVTGQYVYSVTWNKELD
jgi:hypothetical protein